MPHEADTYAWYTCTYLVVGIGPYWVSDHSPQMDFQTPAMLHLENDAHDTKWHWLSNSHITLNRLSMNPTYQWYRRLSVCNTLQPRTAFRGVASEAKGDQAPLGSGDCPHEMLKFEMSTPSPVLVGHWSWLHPWFFHSLRACSIGLIRIRKTHPSTTLLRWDEMSCVAWSFDWDPDEGVVKSFWLMIYV